MILRKCILMLLIFLVSQDICLSKEANLDGQVQAGSKDNQLTIRINNNTSTEVLGITATAFSKEIRLLKNIVVSPEKIAKIAPDESVVFSISFDVDKDIVEEKNIVVSFQVDVENGEIDNKLTTLNLKILPSTVGSVVYHLVSAGTSTPKDLTKGYTRSVDEEVVGGSYQYYYQGYGTEINYQVNVGLTDVPLEIVLGEPFELSGKITMFTSYSKNHACHKSKRQQLTASEQLNCATRGEEFLYGWYSPNNSYIKLNPSGITDFTIKYEVESCVVRSTVQEFGSDNYPCDSEEGQLLLMGGDRKRISFFTYKYRASSNLKGFAPDEALLGLKQPLSNSISKNGFIELNDDISEDDYDKIKHNLEKPKGDYTHEIRLWNSLLRITLEYRPVLAGGEFLSSIQPFNFPNGFNGQTTSSVDEPRVETKTTRKTDQKNQTKNEEKTKTEKPTKSEKEPDGVEKQPEKKVEKKPEKIEKISVPDLVGKSEGAAKITIKLKGLSPNIIGYKETNNKSLAGKVFSQLPKGGALVKVGKTVVLVIYKSSMPDCTKWSGSSALWNEKQQKYECGCSGDYVRNKANNACRLKKSVQLAEQNCKKYGLNSEIRWVEKDEKTACYCLSGYEWDKSGTECIMNQDTMVKNTDCSSGGRYGEAYWDYQTDSTHCRCVSGYFLDSNKKCVAKTYTQQEPVRREEPIRREEPDDFDEVDLQKFADDLTAILTGKKANQRSNQLPTKPKPVKKTEAERCAYDYQTNGTYFNCNCSGYGFDLKYARCRKGFSDKYSSHPTKQKGVYAGFGSASGKPHVCIDKSVRITGRSTMYARFYGGGHQSFDVKGNIICVGYTYYELKSGNVDKYLCPEKDMTGCRLQSSDKIEKRESRSDGGYQVIYKDGAQRIVVMPIR